MKRNLNESILEGDVIRIYGVSGKTGKSKNGYYYVSGAYSYANDSKHWSLVSLKTANGSKFEGIGKKTEYWPFEHCFSSRPDIRAEYMENVKGAKIENLGPLSLAVYNEFVNELKELEEGNKKHWIDNSERLEKVRDIVARMASENPSLETTRKWREEHPVKPEGPGLRIARNGLDVREKNGTWTHYGLTINFEEGKEWRDGRECVYIYGSWGRGSSSIPGGFALDIKNDTDSMTDYFDTDSARIFDDHPLYAAFKSVAQGGHAYTLTDSDAEKIKTYMEAKKAAAEAAKKAEAEREREEEERKERHAREVIDEYVGLFPCDPSAPHVFLRWSEFTPLAELSAEFAGEPNPAGADAISLDAFEMITGELDAYYGEMKGYCKMAFTLVDGESEFNDRCDIGEGTGSYGARMRAALDWLASHPGRGDESHMLDGGACVTRDEYEAHARRYLGAIPATFGDIDAA